MMNRRTFLCGLTLGTLPAPLATGAQPTRLPAWHTARSWGATSHRFSNRQAPMLDMASALSGQHIGLRGHDEIVPMKATDLVGPPGDRHTACYVPTLFTIRTTYVVPVRCLAAFGGEAKRPMHS
jgi:hypothetical protein